MSLHNAATQSHMNTAQEMPTHAAGATRIADALIVVHTTTTQAKGSCKGKVSCL